MRMTYRQMAKIIDRLSNEQLDCDVTVEIPEEEGSECYPADFRICGIAHDSLDDGHPVIYVNYESEERMSKEDFNLYLKSII